MEESYGYEEPYEPTDPGYSYSPPPSHSRSYSTHHYEPEYEPEYYRESSVSYGKEFLFWMRLRLGWGFWEICVGFFGRTVG